MASNLTDPLAGLIPPPTEVNDTHKVYSVAAACVVLCVVACLTVFARLGLRIRQRDLEADDYAIIPATLLYIGWSTLAIYVNLNAGVGKPLWEITLDEYTLWFKGIVVSMWLYPLMSASIRVSTLFFYKRIFGKSSERRKKFVWVLMGLQGVYMVAFSIVPAFICDPYHYAWKPLERREHCHDIYYYESQVALYTISMFFDAVLLIFPIFPVLRLHMSMAKRLGIAVIFVLGASASVAAAYKLGIFVDQQRYYIPTDTTWLQYLMSRFVPGQFNQYGTTFWIPSQVEPAVALIGTSMPALRKIFKNVTAGLSTLRSKGTDLSNKQGSNNSNPFPRTFVLPPSTQSLVGSRGERTDHGLSLDTLEHNHASIERGGGVW